jgi:hypothetical protein
MAGCNLKGTSAAVRRASQTHGVDIWGPSVCAPPRLQLVRLVVADELVAAHVRPARRRAARLGDLLAMKFSQTCARIDLTARRPQRGLGEGHYDVYLVRYLFLGNAPAA